MLNPEVLTLWEHFHRNGAWDKTHETGYFRHQTRTMRVQERDRELWLAPFITINWLQEGRGVSVKNAPTRFGAVSYEINSQIGQGFMEARIEPPTRQSPQMIASHLRHPEGGSICAVIVNGKRHTAFDPARKNISLKPRAGTLELRAEF